MASPRRKAGASGGPPVRSTPPAGTRSQQVTLTDEDALERARQLSIEIITPPAFTPEMLLMNERFDVGDYAGALEVADAILAKGPSEVASKVRDRCAERLAEGYVARLGALDRVPVVLLSKDELKDLALDHRAGFLFSIVDGISDVETLLDVSGMPRLDALRIMVELLQKRAITMR